MNTILEAKLSSEHRKNLSDKDFGLPKERKFPLNDESHVQSAIRFFKYAKRKDRMELARNINSKLKKFDMTVKVGKNNPFYKYIDKKYLSESSIVVIESIISNNNITHTRYQKILDKLINNLNEYTSEENILIAEYEIYKEITVSHPSNEFLCFLKEVNDIMSKVYREYYMCEEYDSMSTSFCAMYYTMLDDIYYSFMKKINNNESVQSEMDAMQHFIATVCPEPQHNWFYIYRILCYMYYSTHNNSYHESDYNTPKPTNLTPNMYPKRISVSMKSNGTDNFTFNKSIDYKDTTHTLDNIKNNILGDLRYVDNDIVSRKSSESNFKEYINRVHSALLYDKTSQTRLACLVGNKLLEFNNVDIVRLSHMKCHTRVQLGTSLYAFAESKNELYLAAKIDNAKYKMIPINTDTIDYIVDGYNRKVEVTTLDFSEPLINTEMIHLTEGLSVDKDGNIKITINPKKSYMDEYSEAHRILVENYKNKNYEAMKENVAFMFLLISIIERDTRYKNREPEIVKARAFAINDFKTYLSYIQQNEPSFNFEKYYKESEFDKYIIDIPKETLLGIRNLLKTIII